MKGIMERLARPQAAASDTLERLILETYGGITTASGVNVTTEKAMRLGVVFACVLVLSQSVAQLPLHLFRRSGRDRERLDEHPAALLIKKSNTWMTSYEFKQILMVNLVLQGNSYWLKTRGTDGRVRELIPLDPARIKGVEQDENFELFYHVRRPDGSIDPIPAYAILHIKGLSLNGLQGLSPIAYAREMLGLAISQEKHGAKLFSQGTRLGGVLYYPGKLTGPAVKRLKKSFEDSHATVENAHKTAVLEEGMKWEKVSMTAEDAQFLESRNYQRSEIAGFFRVPAHFINDLTHATFTNVEHLDLAFAKHSLTPWIVNIEQSLERALLTDEEQIDHYFKFNLGGLLRGDSASRAAAYQSAILNGYMSPNEVRELEDRNPYPEGDDFRIPLNVAPVSGEKDNEESQS